MIVLRKNAINKIPFRMIDADGIGVADLTIEVELLKENSLVWEAFDGSIEDNDEGSYRLVTAATDTDVDGFMGIRLTATGALQNTLRTYVSDDEANIADILDRVTTALPDETPGTTDGLALTSTVTAISPPSAETIADAVRTELTTEMQRITTALPNELPGTTDGLPTVADLATAGSAPSADAVADAVRVELSPELALVSTALPNAAPGTDPGLATVADLADAGNAPSAGAVADAVRLELANELDRVMTSLPDAAPSTADGLPIVSDLASAGSAPSATQNADAVRSELTSELARVMKALPDAVPGDDIGLPRVTDLPEGGGGTADEIADAVRVELTTEMTRITTALPNAAPGTALGLPRTTDLPTTLAIPGSTGIITVVGYATTDFYADIAQGEDRTGAQATIITVENWAGFVLTDATVKYRIVPTSDYYVGNLTAEFEKELSYSVDGTTITITLAITSAESGAWSAVPADAKPNYRHQLWIFNADESEAVMLQDGWLRVREPIEEPAPPEEL